ncbi:MAG: conjugative transposon protein TraM [Chryseobacterium sp.]|nr:MAG: conjugative transposon protein TraM [Chryseobacterium sp.]
MDKLKEKFLEFYNEKKVLFWAIVGVLVLIIGSQLFGKKEKKSEKAISWKVGDKDVNKDSVSVAKVKDLASENGNDYDVVSQPSSGYQSSSSATNELDYLDKLDKQDVSSSTSSSGSSAASSYSPYGSYSMWQEKEPSNSKIGYSSKKRSESPATSTPSYSEVKSYQPEPIQEAPYINHSTTEERKGTIVAQVKAKLISQGYATNNRSISFVTLENFTLNGEIIPKGKSYAGGSLKLESDRILARINTIKANGKTYNVTGKIIGYDGEEGLPLIVNENSGSDNNIIRDEAVSQAGRIPVVGGLLSRATSGSSHTKTTKIPLSGNIETTIVIYK